MAISSIDILRYEFKLYLRDISSFEHNKTVGVAHTMHLFLSGDGNVEGQNAEYVALLLFLEKTRNNNFPLTFSTWSPSN